eukprot:733392-Rhodomonas_salina.1
MRRTTRRQATSVTATSSSTPVKVRSASSILVHCSSARTAVTAKAAESPPTALSANQRTPGNGFASELNHSPSTSMPSPSSE